MRSLSSCQGLSRHTWTGGLANLADMTVYLGNRRKGSLWGVGRGHQHPALPDQ